MTKAELEARVKELETMVDTLEQEKAFINKVNNNLSNTDFDNKKKLEQFEQFKRDVFRVGFRDQFAVSGYPIHLDCEDLIENLEMMYNYYETCINEEKNEARDLINNIRHRLKIDDNEPDSYILDRLRSITESKESYEKECTYLRKEATAVRGELGLPYTADIDMVRSKIQDLKKCKINVPYVPVDTLKLKRFKQELGDILGISKEASYPEFVKAVKELKAANECQKKSIHDTLDSLIKLRKEKDDEERKLREMLIISNRDRDDAMATFDEVFDEVRDIWNLCCDGDGVCDDECDIDELLADIFEFCDRASTARNHLENERKLICDLYESVFGESAGSKASVILIGEIVRKLETWEKDKDDQIKRLSVDKNSILECLKEAYAYICSVTCTINNPYMLLYGIRDAWDTKRREYRLKIEDTAERARKAEKKLDDISKIIESSGRDKLDEVNGILKK